MSGVERLSRYFTRSAYTVSGPFHPFGGAVDIIVVQQPNGSFKSSPWHVRFGKFQGVLKSKERAIDVCVNGVDTYFHMYLDNKGEAYFPKEPSGDGTDKKAPNLKLKKMESSEFDSGRRESIPLVEVGNGKIVAQTTSKRPPLLGFMFGNKSMKEDEKFGDVQRVSSLERAEIVADLLEMKWSTNLSSNVCRGNKNTDPRFERDTANANDNKEGSPQQPSSLDECKRQEVLNLGSPQQPSSLDECKCQEVLNLHVAANSATSILSTECVEESSVHSLARGILNEELITDEMRLKTNEFGATLKESILSNESNNSHGEGVDDCLGANISSQEYFEEMTSNCLCLCDKSEEVVEIRTLETDSLFDKSDVASELRKIETDVLRNLNSDNRSPCSSSVPHDPQQAVDERSSDLGEEDISSFSYCKAIEATTVRSNDSSDKTLDTLIIGQGKHLEPHFDACSSTVDLTYEVERRPESAVCADAENAVGSQYRNLEKFTVEDSCAFENPQTDYHSNQTSVDITELSFSIDSHVVSSECRTTGGFSVFEDTSQDKPTDELAQEKECEVNEGSNAVENTLIILSKHVEDDELQFTKNDACNSEIPLEPWHDNAAKEKVDPLSNSELDLEEHELKDEHKKFFGGFSEVSWTDTCPINIPGSMLHLVEKDLLVRSLPNIRTQIHDLESSDLQQSLSCSLNPDSCEYMKEVVKNKYTSSSKWGVDSGSNVLRDQLISAAVVADKTEEKESLVNPSVELSFCKQCSYEEVGSDAAHLTLDVEKEFIFEPHGVVAMDQADNHLNRHTSKATGSWRVWPFSLKKSKTLSTVQSALEGSNGQDLDSKLIEDEIREKSNMKKALTPTSEQLASLNLKEGRNAVTFSFSTAMLGRQQVDARIYLWKWNTRIVISDVDGTITKSDVLGQFMHLVGVDWSQTGVAHLFSAIKENGYQLLFLSARAISQAHLTRQFLFNLKQDGKALPDGPVVISPDGLFPSLYREVIRRAPHEFKISCLEDIRALFPTDCSPFYAGFGNRDTDEISYLKVGIPKAKIFIINPKGEVAVNRRVDMRSYTSLHALVDEMFPAMSSAEQEDFNTWNYWKLPLPDVDI